MRRSVGEEETKNYFKESLYRTPKTITALRTDKMIRNHYFTMDRQDHQKDMIILEEHKSSADHYKENSSSKSHHRSARRTDHQHTITNLQIKQGKPWLLWKRDGSSGNHDSAPKGKDHQEVRIGLQRERIITRPYLHYEEKRSSESRKCIWRRTDHQKATSALQR